MTDPELGNSPQSEVETQSLSMPIEGANPGQTEPSHCASSNVEKLDIEHAIVEDDPRKWSKGRKVCLPDKECMQVPLILHRTLPWPLYHAHPSFSLYQ